MREFVSDHIIGKPRRQLQQFPIKEKHSILSTRTPAKAKIAHLNALRLGFSARGNKFNSALQPFRSGIDVPPSEVLLRRSGITSQSELRSVEFQRLHLALH